MLSVSASRSVWRLSNESSVPGSGLCIPPIAQGSGVYRYRAAHARARHRCQLGHLHAGQCPPASDLRVLYQDLGYAFRQLRKAPGFTVTVLLTLALGIGANSAIFTLVNAILLHNLPVTDPKTLIRIGDKDDCCVNGGWHDDGDYSLFATDTYYMFKKSLPEFEELAD